MIPRSVGAALLLLQLLACAEQPLTPVASAAPRSRPTVLPASDPAAAAAQGAAARQFTRTELAIGGVEDALGRLLPFFADAQLAGQVEVTLRAVLEALSNGDSAVARQALAAAEAAIRAYGDDAVDAAAQAPELEVLRFALVQARIALAHPSGTESAPRSESSLPQESISKLEEPS